MKKFIISALAVCAGVAAGLFVFTKLKKKNTDEVDDLEEFDDDFSDDEPAKEATEA